LVSMPHLKAVIHILTSFYLGTPHPLKRCADFTLKISGKGTTFWLIILRLGELPGGL
jgi:hypothetical protein